MEEQRILQTRLWEVNFYVTCDRGDDRPQPARIPTMLLWEFHPEASQCNYTGHNEEEQRRVFPAQNNQCLLN